MGKKNSATFPYMPTAWLFLIKNVTLLSCPLQKCSSGSGHFNIVKEVFLPAVLRCWHINLTEKLHSTPGFYVFHHTAMSAMFSPIFYQMYKYPWKFFRKNYQFTSSSIKLVLMDAIQTVLMKKQMLVYTDI